MSMGKGSGRTFARVVDDEAVEEVECKGGTNDMRPCVHYDQRESEGALNRKIRKICE